MQPRRQAYEDLAALVELQASRIDEMAGQVAHLRADNEEVRRRLGMNSSTSSCPPSADGPYDKPRPKPSALRGRSGRRPGKQPGEPGVTRRRAATPDEERRVEPGACAGCGGGLGDAPVVGIQKRQVFEASPPPPPRVIEFVVVARVCPGCGVVNVGQAPAWASGRGAAGAGRAVPAGGSSARRPP